VKRVLTAILLLAAALVVALAVRVRQLRAAGHGPAGGTGVIEGVDVNVTSRIATRIARIDVREGDAVKRGDVLVELDCAEAEANLAEAAARLESARASLEASRAGSRSAERSAAAARAGIGAADSQLAALEAQERLARVELERAESLRERDAATAAAVDEARSRHETLLGQVAAQRSGAGAARDQAGASASAGGAARAQAVAARSNVEVARAAVARAEVAARECTLRAPRDGVVAARNLEPGEAVQPGSVILALTDVSEARTRFYLPNEDLAVAAPGRGVDVVADAYPRQTFHGTITCVSPRAEFTPRNVQTREDRERLVYAVEVRIPNPDLRLRAGMPVEVRIDGSAR
jgi:HlyD family secretion protein